MDRHLRDLLDTAVGEPPHRVTAEAVRHRVIKRRVVECVAGAAAVAVIAAIIPVGIGALGRALGPPTSSNAAAHVFTSRHYGYTEALPAGWRFPRQATQQWDGKRCPADTDSIVDHFQGPGGVEAWAYAAPTKENSGDLHENDHAGRRRGTSVSGDPANQPGHHDRRSNRPAA
jgi:hypothetical protein